MDRLNDESTVDPDVMVQTLVRQEATIRDGKSLVKTMWDSALAVEKGAMKAGVNQAKIRQHGVQVSRYNATRRSGAPMAHSVSGKSPAITKPRAKRNPPPRLRRTRHETPQSATPTPTRRRVLSDERVNPEDDDSDDDSDDELLLQLPTARTTDTVDAEESEDAAEPEEEPEKEPEKEPEDMDLLHNVEDISGSEMDTTV
jgi:hypothetical protein